MKYIKSLWHHSHKDEPSILYYEIDQDRIPVRVLEIYKDDRFGLACDDLEYNGTFLDGHPIPELSEINQDKEFLAEYIDKAEFEKIWNEYFSIALSKK